MSEYLKMAKSGRIYLLGPGQNKINPIHAKDLARVCVEAAENKSEAIEESLSHEYVEQHPGKPKIA